MCPLLYFCDRRFCWFEEPLVLEVCLWALFFAFNYLSIQLPKQIIITSWSNLMQRGDIIMYGSSSRTFGRFEILEGWFLLLIWVAFLDIWVLNLLTFFNICYQWADVITIIPWCRGQETKSLVLQVPGSSQSGAVFKFTVRSLSTIPYCFSIFVRLCFFFFLNFFSCLSFYLFLFLILIYWF